MSEETADQQAEIQRLQELVTNLERAVDDLEDEVADLEEEKSDLQENLDNYQINSFKRDRLLTAPEVEEQLRDLLRWALISEAEVERGLQIFLRGIRLMGLELAMIRNRGA